MYRLATVHRVTDRQTLNSRS